MGRNIDELEDRVKYFALLEEVETSIRLIRVGFGEMQNLSLNNGFIFLPLQLLSQGFERLLKSYICIINWEEKGTFPEFKLIKGLGHDIQKIKDVILQDFSETAKFSAKECEFLISDTELNELLHILSEFGKLARYYNFDVITGNKKPSVNTKELWEKYESKILKNEPELYEKLMDNHQSNEVFQYISFRVIRLFEKFAQAFCSKIIYGPISSGIGIYFTFILNDFADLIDENYGKTNYRTHTIKYKEELQAGKKRGVLFRIKLLANPNFKTSRIKKKSYVGDWPFYTEKVTVISYKKNWCTVLINGREYALNGSAKDKFKLENPHDSGEAIVGKSLGNFITIARNLWSK